MYRLQFDSESIGIAAGFARNFEAASSTATANIARIILRIPWTLKQVPREDLLAAVSSKAGTYRTSAIHAISWYLE